MTAKLIGIVVLAALGGAICQTIARERRRRAAREEEVVNRWEGEGGALADSPAAPYEPRPDMIG